MWQRPPDRQIVDGWIERALALAEEGSSTYAKALAAAALWRKDEAAARELHGIAVRSGDAALRSSALAALADVAWSAGDLAQAHAWVEERLALLPELTDPDDRHFACMSAVEVDLAMGRIGAAEQASALLVEMVEGLTPHHRLHGVDMQLRIDSLVGRWEKVEESASHAELAVGANAATPCLANCNVLLNLAVARAQAGDDPEARRLEAVGRTFWVERSRWHYEPAEVRLALARNDLAELRRLVASPTLGVQRAFGFDGAAELFDALVALGDHGRIESEAPRWVKDETYTEPFALRALGVARGDVQLLDRATAIFDTMGMEWHAAATRKLAASA